MEPTKIPDEKKSKVSTGDWLKNMLALLCNAIHDHALPMSDDVMTVMVCAMRCTGKYGELKLLDNALPAGYEPTPFHSSDYAELQERLLDLYSFVAYNPNELFYKLIIPDSLSVVMAIEKLYARISLHRQRCGATDD